MIKITSETINGNIRSLKEVADDYYVVLKKHHNKISSIRSAISSELNPNTPQSQRDFLQYIHNEKNLKEIIISPPEKLKEIIDQFNNDFGELFYSNNKETDFGKIIKKIFNYDGFRKSLKAHWLAKELKKIKACPYCNSQFTMSLAAMKNVSKGKILYQFDHYFPKSRYPYLSIALFNLIPSCAVCNNSKSSTDFTLNNHVHPYCESFHKLSKFTVKGKTVAKYIFSDMKDHSKIDISLVPRDPHDNANNDKIMNHDEIFSLEAIYKNHTDIVGELYLKAYIYNATYKKQLMSLPGGNGANLFTDDEEFNNFIVGNYSNEKDILKRPLSKLSIDIAEELELI
jgi:5-methylcytosine-specific restriction endonuclease McrA